MRSGNSESIGSQGADLYIFWIITGAGGLHGTGAVPGRGGGAGFRTGEIVRALKKFAANPDLLDGFEPPEETLD